MQVIILCMGTMIGLFIGYSIGFKSGRKDMKRQILKGIASEDNTAQRNSITASISLIDD